MGLAFGTRNAFAVFLIAVVEEFRWSRGLAAGALMLGSVVWTIGAPVVGMLLDRLGPRVVLAGGAIIMALGLVVSGLARGILEFYLGIGLLVGAGFASLTMTSQATFLSNWFIRKRGMAIGLAASGIGLGIFMVVPATQWLIETWGWRSAIFTLAGLLAIVVAPLNYFFQRQRPEDMDLKPDFGEPPARKSTARVRSSGLSGPSLNEALHERRFWVFSFGVLAGAIPLHMILIHQVAAVSDAGFSKEVAAVALGMIGLFTAPAMILMGILADRIGRQAAYVLGSASLMVGILLLMMIDVTRPWIIHA
ncbi:MAG TPA: MFS transporter, partial [Candidatus Eisenbacteria bacterium]|nr:MFS transporter [Candidatus Eisenbacteria bacterium]